MRSPLAQTTLFDLLIDVLENNINSNVQGTFALQSYDKNIYPALIVNWIDISSHLSSNEVRE